MSTDAALRKPEPPEAVEAEGPRPAKRVHSDLMFLAGELLHRGAQTHYERRAAEFIRDRFRGTTQNVEVDDFHAIENPAYLFGSYFGEFVVVGVLAYAWPAFALAYGFGLLVAFLAEYHGVRIFERLLPEYETQNVVARYLSLRPRKLIIVTAHYDSGGASLLSNPGVARWLRPALLVMLVCMVLVLATCGAEAWAIYRGQDAAWLLYPRWVCITLLICGATFMFFASRNIEDIRGANGNASGVAVLLQLAERIKARDVEGADVWLAATGSHEAWMAGARRLVRQAKSEQREIHLLNIESVGAGNLHYTTTEGMLGANRCAPALIEAAARCAATHGATPTTLRSVPTGAHVALVAGIKAMSIVGVGEDGVPVHWNQIDDRITNIDEPQILRAADFAEGVVRVLAARP